MYELNQGLPVFPYKLYHFSLQIFTERPSEEPVTERMRPDTVVDYLHRYPKAVITYLEYLVFQKKLEVIVYLI